MITPQEIKKQCLNWWKELLLSVMAGEGFFPRVITRIGKITAKDILLKLTEHKAAIAELQKGAATYGYNIEMSEKNFDKIGFQTIPSSIVIPSLDVYLRITRKRSELDIFTRNLHYIETEMPQLLAWAKNNPLRLISHNTWSDTVKVCQYFIGNPRPNLYIRELPIDVHTKYIEENKDLLRSLLDTILPESAINSEEKTFEKRYGLKIAEPLIRIRFLDTSLAYNKILTDISIPLTTFSRLNCPCKRLFVTENKMNFLTLPQLPDSIALWSGGGFNVSYLKDIPWLKNVQSFYWGDLDAQGLQILNQFRSYFPSTISLLMNWDTFHRYTHLFKEGTPAPLQVLPNLTADEYSLYLYLQENNLRLEQERIPHSDSLRIFTPYLNKY